MKLSNLFMSTLREVPAEAEIPSHRLMLRASLMRQTASGVYAFLPLGYRVLRKIERIVRQEMDAAGAQELLMPALISSDLLRQSGRWEVFGEEMFRLRDRGGRDFCLGPTHEELFTDTVGAMLRSYKSLPVTLYQIQTKFRDERRPRFGVIRSREFIMKDAYSFDIDEKGLDESYGRMYKAYCRIFDRIGLKYLVVDADSGAMGGSGSQEYMVLSEIGEDELACCQRCSYAANMEKAQSAGAEAAKEAAKEPAAPALPLTPVDTPDIHAIDEVCAFFGCTAAQVAKTIIYLADGKPVAVMVRGDRKINETKLKNLLACAELTLAPAEVVMQVTGAQVGFAGPLGLRVPLYADYELCSMPQFIAGANKTDMHLTGVNVGRDMAAAVCADLHSVSEGDACPVCGGALGIRRGIEIGHIFKLGTKYTKALGCVCLNEQSREVEPVMGCYGIGVNRLMAAVIEQNCDADGIRWPLSVAPYQAVVVPAGSQQSDSYRLAEEIYARLNTEGVEVLLDDRALSAGVKFKDSDLIGIPVRVTAGRKASQDVVELRIRGGAEPAEMPWQQAVERICAMTEKIR